MPTTIFADLRINTAPGYRDIEVFRSRLGRGFSQPLGRISGDAAEFSKSLQAAAARVSAFGAITGGLLAVNKVISATARATIEVNKQLVELNTYLGESQSNLDRFGKSLFTIARNTATNFADVAEAAKEFARQGLSTEETLKRTNDALVLSRVSGLNYAQSVNSITTALNGFNKEALSSSEVINKLIAVDSRFAVSAAQLSEALTRVGSSAEESGLSFDELVATVTTAQQITGRGGAVIGNALKTIFTRVRRPEILEQLKQIGVTVTDQNGSLLNAIEILKNYADATRNLSQVEKARTAELLGGVYQINQLQAVIRDLSSANSIYASSLKIASTATDEARKKNEELNKSYSALLAKTGTLATQVGEQVGKDLFGPLITGGTSLANSLLGVLAPDKIEDIGSKAGESLANGFFDKFRETLKPATSGLLQTAGNLLLNIGGPLALGLGALLTARLGKFLITSFKTISKDITSPLNRYVSGGTLSGEAEQKKLALVNQIAAVLQKNSYVNNNITSSTYSEARARKEVLAQIRLQNLELQRQKTLSETIVRSVSSRTPPVFDLRDLPPARPRRRRAGGYIPAGLFDLAEQEVSEAKQFGAKNPKAKLVRATVKGRTQTIMANDQEDIIPNFAGTGETAFIPRYRRMQDVPSMSNGYIPNFASSKFVKNIVDSYKASLTEKDAVRLGQANKAASYYPIVNSELKTLSNISGFGMEKLAYSLAALSGNTSDLDARKGLERIIKNQPYDDLAILPKNVEKVKKMLASSGSPTELMSILGKGAKTQNFAQSLLLSDKFSGFGNYQNPIGVPSVMDSWAIYVRNGGALKDKYDRRAVSEKQKRKLFSQSPSGYKYYNKLVKEYAEAAQILGVPVRDLQARTWGWARGQMGSVTRNSFASGYIPNFATPRIVGQGSNLFVSSLYDSLSGKYGGGPEYPFVRSGMGAAFLNNEKTKDMIKLIKPFVESGSRVIFGAQAGRMGGDLGLIQGLAGNKMVVETLKSAYPKLTSKFIQEGTSTVDLATLFKKFYKTLGPNKMREIVSPFIEPDILRFYQKNKNFGASISRLAEFGKESLVEAASSQHSIYPNAIQGKALSRIDPVNAQELFKIAGNLSNEEVLKLMGTVRVAKLPIGFRWEKGDAASKILGLSNGYIPNFSGLSDAINREESMTGLPASQIMAHFDGKGNPIAVTNKKDEPRGLNDVINKSKGYVPNFAPFRGPGGRFAKKPTGNAEGGVGGVIEFFVAEAVSGITNTLLSQGLIDEETAIGIQSASGITAVGSQLYKGLKASKGQSFGRKAASVLPALLTGAAVAGTSVAGFSNATSQRKQREIDKEADKSANEFKNLTEGTQELIDTISKLDAAFKDASSTPDQLLKLGKRESELINTLSVKNNDLAIRLRAEPSVERRVNLIEEARRSATQKKSIEDEVLSLKQQEKATPEDLLGSFQKLTALGGDKLLKASQQDLAPENIDKLLKSANLEPLLKFFNSVDETTKTKLIPQFLEVVKAEQKYNEISKKASEDLGRIRAGEISLRNRIQNERLKRQAETEARTEGLGGVKEFVSKFGERSSISFESDIKKADAQKSALTAFTNRVSALNNDRSLKLDPQLIKGLLEIKQINDKTFLTVKGLISGVSDPETKKKLEDLAGFAENQYKELQTQNAIAEIQKNAQLKVLSIQEKLSFGGGISTSVNARSRIDSINAPLRGALEYRLGSMLGSERSQAAGLTNLFKSLKDQFPGLLESSKGLANVTKTLTNLKFKDLQRDLLRNADLLQSTGFGNEAQLLRQKALSPQGMLELRSMAESQANAELSSGQTPTEATNYLNENLVQVLKSLATKLDEEAAIKAKEKETEPQQQEVITKANEQRDKLYTDIKKTIEQAFGNQVNIQKSIITAPNSVINATTNSTPSYSGQNPPPIPLGMSKGFIPSFYNPLREAIDRESQYVPESSIRVNQSKKLVSSSNPFGLAVTNTIDEPNGLSSIGLASRGFIPNFADKEKEMLQPPGTAKIPVISKMVGRFFTNVTTPVNYDLGSKVKQLGETGLGGSLYSFITDTPSDQVTAGYKKGTYVADKGATEAREPVYRWMYGLEPQTDWQKFYVKNADNTVSFNRGTPEGKNLFNRAVLNAVKSKLEGDPTAHRHSVMSNYGYSIEGGKLKFFDRWDFDTHEGEQGLFDFFKPSSKPSGDLANPNSAYNQVNKDVASGSFTGRLKNTIRAGMSSVTEPVNITGEIPLSELPKLFKEADRTYKYKDQKTGKVISEYPFLKDPSLLKKITPNTNPQVTANFAKGYVPNFAIGGEKMRAEALKSAEEGKLYLWDNDEQLFRKVNKNGSLAEERFFPNELPKGAKFISASFAPAAGESTSISTRRFNVGNLLGIKPAPINKLGEISYNLPGIAQSSKLDGVLRKLDRNNNLNPERLLLEIEKMSGGSPVVVKTAFGETNGRSEGVFGVSERLNKTDAATIIKRFKDHQAGINDKGYGFFTQKKVTPYYGEARVHVFVDNDGRVKLVKGGIVHKASWEDITHKETIKSLQKGGLSKNDATKVAKSFKKAASKTAIENIRELVKKQKIKNAFFGVDVGATTAIEAEAAGVKVNKFFGGSGRPEVSTIVFELNPSSFDGSSGYLGEKVMQNLFNEITSSKGGKNIGANILSGAKNTSRFLPNLLSSINRFLFPAAQTQVDIPRSSNLQKFPNRLIGGAKNYISDIAKNIGGTASKIGEKITEAPSSAKNILSKIKNIERPKGIRGAVGLAGFGMGALGAAYTLNDAVEKAKERDYTGAIVNTIAGGLLGGSLFGKAGTLLPGALGILEAYNISTSKNYTTAEDFSDIFLGKKPEEGRGISDYVGGAVGFGFDATLATNPLGQAYLLGKYGYRVGNVIENKLGIGERLGEEYAGRDATISAGRASKSFFERAGMTNFNLTKPNLSLADVASGKVSPDDYINYRNAAINDMNIPKEEKERLKRETEKNLDRPLMRDPATGTYKFANAETRYPGEMASTVQTSSMRDVRSARERNAEIVDFQNQVAAEESVKATKERARQRAIENPLPTIMYNDFTGSPNRFYNVPSEENYVTTQRNERMPTPEEQGEMDSKNRSRIVRGIKENESLNELYSSRDKANYLIEQEKTYGTFRKEDFDDPSLYSTYLSRKKEKETADKREMAALKNPAVQELRNRSRTGFYDAEVQQAFARGTSVEQMRRENAGAAQQPSKIGGVQYSDEEIKEAFAKGISVEELRKSKNKSKGFIPNFSSAFLKERQDILNSPAYAGYRNAAPQMSKYYKNVVTNSAEIEVPARDVYNRMGFFGAEPKNPNQQYAILNPAQQAQLGYAANGFVPNFAGEQFANSMSEALQKIFAPMMDKIGSSITNSNVVNINDQRTFETTSDKIAGVMEFLQSQFPNQFARKMGPQNLA